MKFMMLIHHGTSSTPYDEEEWASKPQAEKDEITAAWRRLSSSPGVTSGLGLAPPEQAATVRVKDGKTLTTDGPFVAIKEALGGYYFFEADDIDAAIEMAAKTPATWLGGAVEVRPIVEW